jgi:hypothetical protein
MSTDQGFQPLPSVIQVLIAEVSLLLSERTYHTTLRSRRPGPTGRWPLNPLIRKAKKYFLQDGAFRQRRPRICWLFGRESDISYP